MVSYKPLWRLLVERDMRPTDLRKSCELSFHTMAKLKNGEEVSMAVLSKICKILGVSYGDIMEYIPCDVDNKAI